jgi:hypothetical protein
LIDKHLGLVATFLKDKNELLRKQTLILLSNLIGEDYVKLKDALFYRFIITLVDNSQEIRNIGKQTDKQTNSIFLGRYFLFNMTKIIHFSFIELIFHLNIKTKQNKHPQINTNTQKQTNTILRSLFSLQHDSKKTTKIIRFTIH